MKKITPYLLALIFFALFSRQCKETQDLKDSQDNTAAFLQDSVRYYKNELGQEIALKTALHGDKVALELLLSKSDKALRDLAEKFKNINAAGQVTTITKIDTILIGYEIPVPFEFQRDWQKKDPFYNISGTSTQEGITINSLEIPNTLSFIIGKNKGKYLIEAVNRNPHIKTTGLDSYTLKVPKKRLGVGVFAGYGISSSGLSPIVGVGLSYQLVRF